MSVRSENAFGFRGYNEESDCYSVVDAEKKNGGIIISSLMDDGPIGGPSYQAEMKVEMFDAQATAEIFCHLDDDVNFVLYRAIAVGELERNTIYDLFSSGLTAQFEERGVVNTSAGRFSQFVCDSSVDLYLAESPNNPDEGQTSIIVHVALLPESCTEETPSE